MTTFMLLGIWFCVRARDQRVTHPGVYVPAMLALTVSVLIKYASAPLVLFFMVLVVCQALRLPVAGTTSNGHNGMARVRTAIVAVVVMGCVGGVVSLALFAPFWKGHHLSAIIGSFSALPSATHAENSVLRVALEWVKQYGMPSRTSRLYTPLHILSSHSAWSKLNELVLAVCLLLGTALLWWRPTWRSLVLASLFTLEAILIVTPWFYSWYILWIVALAAILLAQSGSRLSRACILFAFTFSLTAFFTYLSPYYFPFSSWLGARYLVTDAPPVLVFCIALLFRGKQPLKSSEEAMPYAGR
jgi:hypothetical protein